MAILNRFMKRSTQSITRYILYAIGEIVLIFAGITLSIWFSNWNDARKDRDAEVKLLKEFRRAWFLIWMTLRVTLPCVTLPEPPA